MQSQRTTPQAEKICVIGMGPTALSFLVSLLEKAKAATGKKFEITVIEKRSAEFQRQQRLIDYAINDGISWESFLRNKFNLDCYLSQDGILRSKSNQAEIINPNARQKLTRQFLRQGMVVSGHQRVVKNFSIKALQKALLEQLKEQSLSEHVSIHFHTETHIDVINLTNKTINTQTKDGSKIQHEFDTLVICEGEKRNIIKKIKTAIEVEKNNFSPFEFETFTRQLPYHNAAVLFTITIPCNETNVSQYLSNLKMKEPLSNEEVIKKLSELGTTSSMESGQLPSYILDNNFYKSHFEIKNWFPKIYIAGEIPESLANIKDSTIRHEKITAWMKTIASYRLCLPENCFDYIPGEINKNGLSMALFPSQAKYVKNPVMTLPNQAQIILLGDCSMSPVYQAGCSSTIGLNEATTAASCIIKNITGKTHHFEPLIGTYQSYQETIDKILTNSPRSKPYHSYAHLLYANKPSSQQSSEEQNKPGMSPPSRSP